MYDNDPKKYKKWIIFTNSNRLRAHLCNTLPYLHSEIPGRVINATICLENKAKKC
jgi:hypothetical protein